MLLYRHLARNPFICDCNLRWLSEYLQSHPIETSGARCESPRRMQRKKIGLVKNEKFRCKGTPLISHVITSLIQVCHAIGGIDDIGVISSVSFRIQKQL